MGVCIYSCVCVLYMHMLGEVHIPHTLTHLPHLISSTQVLRMGRRTHINIPHHCWGKMGEVFALYAQELPVSEGEEEEGEGGEGGEGKGGGEGVSREDQ